MRHLCTAGLLLILAVEYPTAQSACETTGPPPAVGTPGYQGEKGYAFDYSSDAGSSPRSYSFQLRIKNEGSMPLTFDWEGASFFRRGIPKGQEAQSECRTDGNQPNVIHGIIKYGPNTQFSGPDARFYNYQAVGTASTSETSTSTIRWTAILDNGESYPVNVGITVSRRVNEIDYTFTNQGNDVHIDWPQVVSPLVLLDIRRASPQAINGDRLVLRRDQKVSFQTRGAGQVRVIRGPLSVYTPERVLLYRDIFPGLQFIPGT